MSLHKWHIWSSSGLPRLVFWAESHWVTGIEFFGFHVLVFFCLFSAELLRQLATLPQQKALRPRGLSALLPAVWVRLMGKCNGRAVTR